MRDDSEGRAFVLAGDDASGWRVLWSGTTGECGAFGALQRLGTGIIATERLVNGETGGGGQCPLECPPLSAS